MLKHEFMKEMEKSLNTLPRYERDEILADFEEHFEMGFAEGKSEEEIAAALGSPDQIAREMHADRRVQHASNDTTPGNIMRATWAVIGLSFFNLVIVFGPFVAIAALLFSGWVMSGAFIISPLLSAFGVLFGGSTIFDFFLSISLCGIGLILIIVMRHLTRWLSTGFMRYLRFNMSLVKGGMKNENNR